MSLPNLELYMEIRVAINGHVATLTLHRPHRGNALTSVMSGEICDALQKLAKDISVRVVILQATGKYFCTGMDLGAKTQVQMTSALNQGQAANNNIQVFEAMRTFPKPIICRIHGPVFGGGLGLLFTTDIRIATSNAFFQFPEVKRGLVPALISAYIVPQLGPFRSKQYMLTGAVITPQELLKSGVLSDVVEDEQEMDKLVQKYVDELLTSAPLAMGSVKAIVDHVSGNSFADNRQFVQEVFNKTVHGEESRYGMLCFTQKQTPDWHEFHTKAKL